MDGRMIRAYGEIDRVQYKKGRYCVRHLAYEYTLFCGDSYRKVYVNDMKELKHEISNINTRGVLDAT